MCHLSVILPQIPRLFRCLTQVDWLTHNFNIMTRVSLDCCLYLIIEPTSFHQLLINSQIGIWNTIFAFFENQQHRYVSVVNYLFINPNGKQSQLCPLFSSILLNLKDIYVVKSWLNWRICYNKFSFIQGRIPRKEYHKLYSLLMHQLHVI